MKKILTFLLAALGLTTACGQDNFENTDVQGFAELVADTNVVVLDVRTVDEFTEGHIEGAILIDQKQSDFIDKTKSLLGAGEKSVDKPPLRPKNTKFSKTFFVITSASCRGCSPERSSGP